MGQRNTLTLSALGNSNWLPVDWNQRDFALTLLGRISPGASLTWKAQYTGDGPRTSARKVTISRSGTTATVTDIAHGLTAGDSAIVEGTGSSNLDQMNGVDITVVDANSYTYTVANSGAAADTGAAKVRSFRVSDHPNLTGKVASADDNIAFPVYMVRLKTTVYASGSVYLTVLQGN